MEQSFLYLLLARAFSSILVEVRLPPELSEWDSDRAGQSLKPRSGGSRLPPELSTLPNTAKGCQPVRQFWWKPASTRTADLVRRWQTLAWTYCESGGSSVGFRQRRDNRAQPTGLDGLAT